MIEDLCDLVCGRKALPLWMACEFIASNDAVNRCKSMQSAGVGNDHFDCPITDEVATAADVECVRMADDAAAAAILAVDGEV